MRTARARTGLKAETIAADQLGRRGYRIVASNYRSRYGEVDLIAVDGETLVFVEVRSKNSGGFGTPGESIIEAKRQKLILTAEQYLQEHSAEDRPCRFDVVTVVFAGNRAPEVEVIQGAFTC